jgi:hypothetical protein
VEIKGAFAPEDMAPCFRFVPRSGGRVDADALMLKESSADWVGFTRILETGDDPVEALVYLYLKAPGEAWFDNAFVEEVGPVARSRNVLGNSSFEQAVLPGWPDRWLNLWRVEPRIGEAGCPWTQDDTEAFHGRLSLRMVDRGYLYTAGKGTLAPGTYTFSVYLKGSREGMKARFSALRRDRTTVELTTEWKRYTATVTCEKPPPLAVRIFLQGGGTMWVDAAQIEKGDRATPYEPDNVPPLVR